MSACEKKYACLCECNERPDEDVGSVRESIIGLVEQPACSDPQSSWLSKQALLTPEPVF